MIGVNAPIRLHVRSADWSIYKWLHVAVIVAEFSLEYMHFIVKLSRKDSFSTYNVVL